MSDKRVTKVRGTITLEDGSTSEFAIYGDGGYQQWGAVRERLGATVHPLTAVCDALLGGEYLATDYWGD